MEREDARRNKRLGVPMDIVLEFSSGRRECRISDISEGGCYVDGIAAVAPGENVRLTLAMPEGASVQLSGLVVYVHEGVGFGLQFNDLSEKQKEAVRYVMWANETES